MDNEYLLKIQKLLALSQSPNENEAKAALLKARELMARYKINESDVQENPQEIVEVGTGISYSKRRDPWIHSLAFVIASNYCCISISSHVRGKQTHCIELVGHKDDVTICAEVLSYAVGCVDARIKGLEGINAAQAASFGYGFVKGIYDALNKQNQDNENEWGLVMTVPTDVSEYIQLLPEIPFHSNLEKQLSVTPYTQGYEEGKRFDPTHRLGQT